MVSETIIYWIRWVSGLKDDEFRLILWMVRIGCGDAVTGLFTAFCGSLHLSKKRTQYE
jgi:hypothetical protein